MSDLDTKPRDAPPRGRVRGLMDRFIDTIELIAAIFVGIVAANIFIAVLLRNLFSTAIPDSYNIGQYLLGILIFWGIAATSYRGTHITVDLVWANAGPRMQRVIDESLEGVSQEFVLVDDVVLRSVELPEKVKEAVEEKMKEKQLAEAYEYKVERERLESRRKELEAATP